MLDGGYRFMGVGVRSVEIVYRPGKENMRVDVLSRNPTETSRHHTLDVQVAAVNSKERDIPTLLHESLGVDLPCNLDVEQQKDQHLCQLRQLLEFGVLPADDGATRALAAQAVNFTIVDNILYYVDGKREGNRRAVVPQHLWQSILEKCHAGKMAGHFSDTHLYATLSSRWWWRTMYLDVLEFCKNCGVCATVIGIVRHCKPALQPTPM